MEDSRAAIPPEQTADGEPGVLLDVYPGTAPGEVHLWIRDPSGRNRILRDTFLPVFHIAGRRADLRRAARLLRETPAVARLSLERRRPWLRGPAVEVLTVAVRSHDEVMATARTVDILGGYRAFRFFNVDFRIGHRYLMARRIFPTAQVRFAAGSAGAGEGDLPRLRSIAAVDDQFVLEYPMPSLRVAHLDVVVAKSGAVASWEDPVGEIRLGIEADGDIYGTKGQTGVVIDSDRGQDEKGLLLELSSLLRETDPDVLTSVGGDDFLFPYLARRIAVNGLEGKIQFGREPDPPASSGPGRSFFSYGRVIYKPHAHTLRGRYHLDRSLFNYSESGLHGVIDLARLSRLPVQEIARLSPGTAISSMQIAEAIRSGCMVLWKKNIPEELKTARELLRADRGGLIYEPEVGLHDSVHEFDFASLYPSIMVRHNISPEMFNCDCCAGDPKRHLVPELGYHFCVKEEGLIGRVLRPVLARRAACKARKKESPVWKQRNEILKWVLVTCFGYTGYRNARFGRIECHESINAYGRQILMDATRLAEGLGFHVLHGIVDSLWVTGGGGGADPRRFAKVVGDAMGITLGYEGRYKWIVFLPTRMTGVGALNRYYGVFEDGELKLRGIELRRHDTADWFREVQGEVLAILAQAKDGAGFRRKIPEVLDVVRKRRAELREFRVDPRRLAITNSVAKPLEEYAAFTHAAATMQLLRQHGVEIQPGQVVRYVVLKAQSRVAGERIRPLEMVQGDERYDREFYETMLLRTIESLFLPLGLREEQLRRRTRL